MHARNVVKTGPRSALFARQAIVGRDQQIVAYELLYRGPASQEHAAVTDDVKATDTVIQHSLFRLGIRRSVGRAGAFINMNAESLHATTTEALPQDRVVLELLESVPITAALIDRCRQLKSRGFRLALDDFVHDDERYQPLLAIVDVVKVDIPMVDPNRLQGLIERLRRHPAKLLAEKVDSEASAKACRALGFDLFQGHFFGRPRLVVG